MPAPTLPSELLPATWEKLKVATPAGKDFADLLKAFAKANDALPRSLLDAGKLATADQVEARLDQLKSEPRASMKALSEHGKQIALQGKKLEAELKKNAALAKTGAPAAAKAAAAAPAFVEAATQAFDEASATLAKLHAKLKEAEEKEEGEDDKVQGDFAAFAKPRVIAALRSVRKNDPEAKPVRFMLANGNQHATAYLGVSVSPSFKTKLTDLLKERGDSSVKIFVGTCVWEAAQYTFVGENLPLGGVGKKLKEGLHHLTGTKFKVRLRNADGKVDAAPDEDDDENEAVAAAAARPATDAGAEFNARQLALQPRLKAALAMPGTIAAALKLKVGEASGLAKDRQFAAGMKVLDQIEQLLATAEAKAKAAASGAPGEGARPGIDPAAVYGDFRKRYEPVRKQWDAAMESVDTQITRLQAKLRTLQDEELEDIAEFGLPALTGNHRTPMIAALMQLDGAGADDFATAVARADRAAKAFARHLDDDVRVQVTDENDFGVPMTIRKTLGGSLRDLQAVFATVR